jgi:hypothetical protein
MVGIGLLIRQVGEDDEDEPADALRVDCAVLRGRLS